MGRPNDDSIGRDEKVDSGSDCGGEGNCGDCIVEGENEFSGLCTRDSADMFSGSSSSSLMPSSSSSSSSDLSSPLMSPHITWTLVAASTKRQSS